MPYITEQQKNIIGLRQSDTFNAETSGELNYTLTLAILAYMKRKGLSYQTINDIVGALDGAKAEFQRRIVQKYEDKKIQQNGDVYPNV